MDINKLFLLLQVNDAAFPIGSYTHSYGLETYIQQGRVAGAADAGRYIRQNLKASFLYTELLAAALAYDAATMHKVDTLMELEELLFAGKSPAELREAAVKLGSRFVKTVSCIATTSKVFDAYISRAGKRVSHAVAYGVFCAACGIEKRNNGNGYPVNGCDLNDFLQRYPGMRQGCP
jgi:urease accessory protein